jgi:hypothetical protein
MEKSATLELEEKLEKATLFDESTGELHTSEERAENLDTIRLKLIEYSNAMDGLNGLNERMFFAATFTRVVETYLKIAKKHEDLLEAGK